MLRLILIFIIVFLITRSFFMYNAIGQEKDDNAETKRKKRPEKKKISKEIGEYVDYEEIDK